MPFCHFRLAAAKPHMTNYLWEPDRYPANPRHIGELILKRRYDLKMSAVECRKLLHVDKSTLTKWEQGKHSPSRQKWPKIVQFLGLDRTLGEARNDVRLGPIPTFTTKYNCGCSRALGG